MVRICKNRLWKFRKNCSLLLSFFAVFQVEAGISGLVDQKADTVEVLFGKQKRTSVISSIYSIAGDPLKNVPNLNRKNTLTGLLPGLTIMQTNGEPGEEGGNMFLRGQRTLGNNTPWVLVDGIQRNMDMLEPNEIESITILKDAAATAIYGLRGSNGVILITTKRGSQQRLTIDFDARVAMSSPVKLPKFLDSYNYASLYNEALINDGRQPFYSQDMLDGYKQNADPYLYPNNDYLDMYLKDYSVQQKYNLSVRGGGNIAKYFFAVGYTSNSGIYNVDKNANTYNTNASMDMYSIRSNVDLKVNRNLDIHLNLAGRIQDRTYPGQKSNSVSSILSSLYKLPPNLFPERYMGEYLIEGTDNMVVDPLAGNAQYRNNPYGLLNNSGYSAYKSVEVNSTIWADYKLDCITPGLKATASLSYDSRYAKNANRSKTFEVYELIDENTVRQHGTPGKMNPQWTPQFYQRRLDIQAGLDYARSFGKNEVSAMLKYNYNEYREVNTNGLPNLNSSWLGRFAYAYDSRYLAEFSFSYAGTEQFPKGNRYGFFPAGAIGWNIANESFIKDNIDFLDVLKLRASYGLTGSDKGIPYFYYIENYAQRASITTGVNGAAPSATAWYKALVANPDITWEKSKKANIGLDVALFHNSLNFSFDIFKERSTDILISSGKIPDLFGGIIPQLNHGIVENKGLEFSIGYNDKIGDFAYYANFNLAATKNKVINKDEQDWKESYRYTTGHPVGEQFGLIAEGLFQSQEEIDKAPSQAFYGTVRPGDIRYRDMNNDGKIDSDDITRIGRNQVPSINYGLSIGFSYKNFDFGALFQGTAQSQAMVTGALTWEFYNNGKVLEHHLDRWAYYTDPATGQVVDTRATATYPRLSLAETNNNRQNSTFWQKDVSYLRLKTLELGYSFDQFLKGTFISKARLYLSGYNLLTWSSLKDMDPEMATNEFEYPIQRTFNVGVNLTF